MSKSNRTRIFALAAVVALISSCNLPTATSTEMSSTAVTDTPFESSDLIDEPETAGESISANELGEVFDLAFDAQGALWVGTSGGVVRCDASLESCQFYSLAVGSAADDVRAVALGPDGSLWFGTTAGLVHYNAGAWETTTSSDGLVGDIIFDLAFDADGGLWIGTSNGVSHFANGVWTNYTTNDGLADDYVHCVYATGEQGIWFGTSMGVSRFDGASWTTYDQDSGLPAGDILSITEDAQGVIWLGTLFGGAVRYDAYDWQSYSFSGDMDENVVQAMALGSNDTLWLGTRAGAIRYDGVEWLGYTTAEGLNGDDVRAITNGADGSIYLGSEAGITRFTAADFPNGVVWSSSPATSTGPEGDPISHLTAGVEISIHAIHMINSDRGWAIGGLAENGDHVLRTSDGGLTWLDVTPPEPAPGPEDEEKMATGFFIDETTGWVVYHSVPRESELGSTVLGIWHTFDAGSSWHWSGPFNVDFVGSTFNPPHLDFSTPQTGWIMARLGGVGMHKYPVYLFVTRDGGAHWTRLVDPYESIYLQSCQKTGMSFAFERTGWVTIANCPIEGVEVVMTGDGGATWEAVALSAPDEQPDLFGSAGCETHFPTLFSSTYGALAMSCLRWENDERVEDHYVYVTEDAGETWQTHRYPGGTLLFIDMDNAYALSGDIYRTQDGGETWTKVKSVSWDGQFSFVSQQLGWAVARSETEIALVKTNNGGESWSIIEATIAKE